VGIRSGDPRDVERLLLAGFYHQSQIDRRDGRPEAAAALIEEAGRRFPNDSEVQVLLAESHLLDRRDPAGALRVLDTTSVAPEQRALFARHGLLRVDALDAAGEHQAALAAVEALAKALPANVRVQQRLQQLQNKVQPSS
jgi:hypothetical protein